MTTARAIATRCASPTEISLARAPESRCDAETGQHLVDAAIVHGMARQPLRQPQVLADRNHSDQVQGLQDQSDLAGPEGVAAGGREARHVLAVDADASRSRRGDWITWTVTFLPVVTGMALSIEPSASILARERVLYDGPLAVHLLSLELLLIWFPFGKLMHALFFVFSRGATGMRFCHRGVKV